MWSFVQNKGNQRWLWLAINHDTGDGFCHVFYNSNDECEAIEIFSDVLVYIDDVLVFPGGISHINSIINDLEKESDYYIPKS